MALSELQKILVGGLKLCGVEQGDIVLASLLLKTEDQQWELADYLEDRLDNLPDCKTVMQVVREIAQEDIPKC